MLETSSVLKMSLINCFQVFKRFSHFKFNPNLMKKQASILKKFNDEITDTMEKIMHNQKVKSGRKRVPLSQTTNVLLKMTTGNFDSGEGNLISSGSPQHLTVRREGMSRNFLTTRMKILNNNFSRAVAEIFVADEELSAMVAKYNIRITNVRVTANNRILHIYWVTTHEDVNEAFEFLNSNKGKIHESLIEVQYTNSVPWIVFVYDLQEANDHLIATCFDKCKADLIEGEEKNNLDAGKDFQLKVKDNLKMVDKISFHNPFETVPVDEYCQKMLNYNPHDFYSQLRLRMPDEMSLDAFNLDYEPIMNKVLHNLYRARALHRLNSSDFNVVADHLPPLNMNPPVGNNNSQIEYNTEERIKAIKKFVELNKKRKNKMELKLKRQILEEEIDRLDTYEQLREKLQEGMSELYKDVPTEPETNNDFRPID